MKRQNCALALLVAVALSGATQISGSHHHHHHGGNREARERANAIVAVGTLLVWIGSGIVTGVAAAGRAGYEGSKIAYHSLLGVVLIGPSPDVVVFWGRSVNDADQPIRGNDLDHTTKKGTIFSAGEANAFGPIDRTNGDKGVSGGRKMYYAPLAGLKKLDLKERQNADIQTTLLSPNMPLALTPVKVKSLGAEPIFAFWGSEKDSLTNDPQHRTRTGVILRQDEEYTFSPTDRVNTGIRQATNKSIKNLFEKTMFLPGNRIYYMPITQANVKNINIPADRSAIYIKTTAGDTQAFIIGEQILAQAAEMSEVEQKEAAEEAAGQPAGPRIAPVIRPEDIQAGEIPVGQPLEPGEGLGYNLMD